MQNRLNEKPIFIVGFERGGSNLLLNLLRSHPNVCSPRGETQEVFIGKSSEDLKTRLTKMLRYLPIAAVEHGHILSDTYWKTRKPLSSFSKKRIDEILFHEKLRARDNSQNRFKTEGIEYTDTEISESRLLTKNLNGLVFMSRQFAEMYPDATFIAIIRNGFAVCEGHIRRNLLPLDDIANYYEQACQTMIKDAQELDNFHLFRYEDLIEEPHKITQSIFKACDLDQTEIKKVRMETSKVLNAKGEHEFVKGASSKQLIWYTPQIFEQHFQKGANANQIKRLTAEQKARIVDYAKPSLAHFNYL